MNNGEFITPIIEAAKSYLPGANASIERNAHMHELPQEQLPNQEQVAAAVTDFINYLGQRRGMDVGLYTCDITRPLIAPN